MSISRNTIVLAINTIKQSNFKGSESGFVTTALKEFSDALKQIDDVVAQAKNSPAPPTQPMSVPFDPSKETDVPPELKEKHKKL